MKEEVKKLPWILLGLLLICASLNWFLLPHDIASAGVGAIGHMLELTFSIDRNLTVWTINLTMLSLAGLLLGRAVFLKSVIGSMLFPVVLDFLPQFPVLNYSFLSLLAGSMLFSLGVYTLYRAEASNGGVTIPPIIFEKYFRIPLSRGLLLTNLIIILLNLVTFGLSETLFVIASILVISLSMKCYVQIRPLG